MTTASPGVDMTLVVKTSTGKHFQLVVSRAASVLEFKEKCQEPAEVPANEQRLIYKGRALQDGDLLTEYDVTDQCTIHLLRAPPRAPQAPPRSADGERRDAPLHVRLARVREAEEEGADELAFQALQVLEAQPVGQARHRLPAEVLRRQRLRLPRVRAHLPLPGRHVARRPPLMM